jgi:hypothetical protein
VGVDVDEARGHQLPLGVDLLATPCRDLPDRSDPAVLDGDVALPGLLSAAIDHRSTADHQIMHGRVSSRL